MLSDGAATCGETFLDHKLGSCCIEKERKTEKETACPRPVAVTRTSWTVTLGPTGP